jgi:hypothetical protein
VVATAEGNGQAGGRVRLLLDFSSVPAALRIGEKATVRFTVSTIGSTQVLVEVSVPGRVLAACPRSRLVAVPPTGDEVGSYFTLCGLSASEAVWVDVQAKKPAGGAPTAAGFEIRVLCEPCDP